MTGRPKDEKVWIENMMFTCMRKHNFAQEDTILDFRKACRKKGVNMSRSAAYKTYDRVSQKIDVTSSFQNNINQFFNDLAKVASKATRKYLSSPDEDSGYALDEYLRVAELQKQALNLQQGKTSEGNSIFMQFLQQNNNQEVNVNEVLTNITEGLGEFGPLLQRLTSAQMDTGKRALPALPAKSQTIDINQQS